MEPLATAGTASAVVAVSSSSSAARSPPPKREVTLCAIDSHTIEKRASPKKKALDPLRYIPERAAFFALFSVRVCFEGADADHRVFRTHKQFGALHARVRWCNLLHHCSRCRY